jgi:hypothetical protein
MKRVKYSDFKELVKKKAGYSVASIDRSAPRRRPRDEGESVALIKLAIVSWDRAIQSGKLQRKGPRHYQLRIDK